MAAAADRRPEAGAVGELEECAQRLAIGDHVLHDLQLNAWVLAYRRLVGGALLTWEGETDIEPPRQARQAPARLEDEWTARGLREPQPRLLRPDALLEIDHNHDEPSARILVEYDSTRRVDKNYGKFRRYDAFLNHWWRHTRFGRAEEPPFVVFICQDKHQREQFMATADHALEGHHWHPCVEPERYEYAGRRQILFALERDMQCRQLRRVAPARVSARSSRPRTRRSLRTSSEQRTKPSLPHALVLPAATHFLTASQGFEVAMIGGRATASRARS